MSKEIMGTEKIDRRAMTKKHRGKVLCLFMCFCGFFLMTWLMSTGKIDGFDDTVRTFFYSIRSPLLTETMKVITYFGNWYTIAAISLLLIGWEKTRFFLGLPTGIVTLFSSGVNKAVKITALRLRPDKELHLIEQGGYAFPSGHAMGGLVFYGMIVLCLRRELKKETGYSQAQIGKRRKSAAILTAAGIMLIFLIGMSRIYLGVHFPSDILAGWFLGGAVLSISLIIQDYIEQRSKNSTDH